MATNKGREVAKHVEDQDVAEAEQVLVSPVMNINTANGSGNRISEAEMKRDADAAARALGKMAKKEVTIPKQMAQYLGDTLPACINGACIYVPVDGEAHEVPEPFVAIIKNSLKTINSGDVREQYGFGKKVNDDALIEVK
jgi:hypothetical protein